MKRLNWYDLQLQITRSQALFCFRFGFSFWWCSLTYGDFMAPALIFWLLYLELKLFLLYGGCFSTRIKIESCKVVQCDMFVGAIDSISINYLKILVIKGKIYILRATMRYWRLWQAYQQLADLKFYMKTLRKVFVNCEQVMSKFACKIPWDST